MANEERWVENRRIPLPPTAHSPFLPAPIMRPTRRRSQPPGPPVVSTWVIRDSLIAVSPFTLKGMPDREAGEERGEGVGGGGGPYFD